MVAPVCQGNEAESRRLETVRLRRARAAAPDDPIARQAAAEAGPEAVDVLRDRAAALLPDQLLQPGEIIILLVKPSLWFVILSSLGQVVSFLALTSIALWLANARLLHVSRMDVLLVGLGLTGLRLIWQFLEWVSRVYVLTDRRIIRVKGVLRVSVFETQLKQVQHTSMLFSVRERVFGLGTIAFATAGTGLIEAVWEMVNRPLEVHQQVVSAINRYR